MFGKTRRLLILVAAIISTLGWFSPLPAQTIIDPTLQVQTIVSGLDTPTGLTFISPTDAFVIQKNDGRVQLLHNGALSGTVLDLPVANDSERGLLSLALHPDFAHNGFVYAYYSKAPTDGGTPTNNEVARFHWNGTSLTFDQTIIDLPVLPGPNHNGGKITFGRDGKLYVVVGELNRREETQNIASPAAMHRNGVILRLNKLGKAPTDNPFYSAANIGTSNDKLNDIYAYGVRNSFGITFDPISGQMWDTENGPTSYDEINRIKPGFNSGWIKIQGPLSRNPGVSTADLVNLGPNAYYADPKFSWVTPVGPTDLEFMPDGLLGSAYADDLFSGDVNTGSLYHFDLTSDRKRLDLTGPLADRIADNTSTDRLAEQDSILFGSGFGITSDITVGPDGLYITSLSNGAIYKISKRPNGSAAALSVSSVPLPPMAGSMLVVIAMIAINAARSSHRKRCW